MSFPLSGSCSGLLLPLCVLACCLLVAVLVFFFGRAWPLRFSFLLPPVSLLPLLRLVPLFCLWSVVFSFGYPLGFVLFPLPDSFAPPLPLLYLSFAACCVWQLCFLLLSLLSVGRRVLDFLRAFFPLSPVFLRGPSAVHSSRAPALSLSGCQALLAVLGLVVGLFVGVFLAPVFALPCSSSRYGRFVFLLRFAFGRCASLLSFVVPDVPSSRLVLSFWGWRSSRFRRRSCRGLSCFRIAALGPFLTSFFHGLVRCGVVSALFPVDVPP